MDINKLKQVLKRKKITQAELAKVLDITTGGVSYIFSSGDMKCSQLEAICNYIGVSPAIFLQSPIPAENSDTPVNIQSIVGSNNRQINIQKVEIEKLKEQINHLNDIIRQKDLLIQNQQDFIEILKGNINLNPKS